MLLILIHNHLSNFNNWNYQCITHSLMDNLNIISLIYMILPDTNCNLNIFLHIFRSIINNLNYIYYKQYYCCIIYSILDNYDIEHYFHIYQLDTALYTNFNISNNYFDKKHISDFSKNYNFLSIHIKLNEYYNLLFDRVH